MGACCLNNGTLIKSNIVDLSTLENNIVKNDYKNCSTNYSSTDDKMTLESSVKLDKVFKTGPIFRKINNKLFLKRNWYSSGNA